MNHSASVRSRDKRSPFSLRVVQTSRGVFWDLVDRHSGDKRLIIKTSPQSARKLAQWVLDNVEE